MRNELLTILNYINEGIIIVDEGQRITFFNDRMKELTGYNKDTDGVPLTDVIPGFKRDFFIKALNQVTETGCMFFFSSAMHQGLVSKERQINIKLSRIAVKEHKCVMIECIDVTSQMLRVRQLQEYANELKTLNKKLVEQEKEITRLAYYDGLTGLANRTFFYNLSDKMLQNAVRNKKILGFMFIDIDKFKTINDSYGHAVGDKVLVEVSRILEASIRQNDIVSRHGGDEFLILLSDCKNYSDYQLVVSRIEEANKRLQISEDFRIVIDLSVGASFYPRDGENIDQLISAADKAMYVEKNRKR